MLNYIGSKAESGRWIREFIPTDIEKFVEVFGGMFKLFFNLKLSKYSDLNKIVYSDFNPVNSNYFACLKDHQKLLIEVEKIPYPTKDEYSKGELSDWYFKYMYEEFQRVVFNRDYSLSNPSFEDAARYAFLLSNSYNGLDPENGNFVDVKGKLNSKYSAVINKLKSKKYQDYFDRITDIENLDFIDCIDKYEGEDTLLYLDPPYYNCEHYYSNHSFNLKSHKTLADKLKKLKSKWILSYYYFDKLEKWFPIKDFYWYSKTFNKPSAGVKGAKGEEFVILNYDPKEMVPEGTVRITEETQKNLQIAA